ncbi:hypothetical protein CRG98_028568 [Punica granatum]|uniref:Retrotransposon gag domain-containing protein n=1 Tax=Punica granatum TaxID=22663 RepID=A0A2I0J4R5_PUNGR|nr:hypothetical protein CRG98_028568 [Punica granatum]
MTTNMAELFALLRGPNRASSSSTPSSRQGPTVDPTSWIPPTQVLESADAAAPPTTHAPTVYPFAIPLSPPPALTAIPLLPAIFLTSDQALSAPPLVSMPAPAVVYTTPPPMIFPAPSVPAPPPLPSTTSHKHHFSRIGHADSRDPFRFTNALFPEVDAEQERRLKRMKETIRALQANETRPNASYGDYSLFPSMRLPSKVKIPEFKTYEGTTDPRHHLRHYRGKILQYWDYEEFVIHSFQDSLTGSALDWFMSLKAEDIPTWADLSRKFIDQYQCYAETPSTLQELSTREMAQGQKFEDYAAKWRAQAAKHIPPISKVQHIQLFHSTIRGVYYSHLLANTSSFFDLIEAEKKLDMGMKLDGMEGPVGKVNLAPVPPAAPAYFPPPPQHQPQSIYYSAPTVPPPMTSQPFVHHYTPVSTPSPQPKPPMSRAPPPAQQAPGSQGPQANPLPDHRPSSGPYINMISVCTLWEDANVQDDPPPFVIDYTPKEPTVEFTRHIASLAPLVIDIPAREPYLDNKVPWTYERGVGNLERQFSVMGVTRSGRVYENPVITDKGKARATEVGAVPRTTPFPPNKVTEEEVEVFMKIIKASEYRVVEQMAKSPAHVSLLTLLLSSEPHREALLQVLTAVQVPKETPLDRIEATVSSIFSNTISFSEDELPSEGKHEKTRESSLDRAKKADLNPEESKPSLGHLFLRQTRELFCLFRVGKGNHLHRLTAYYGKLNRDIPIPPLSHFFLGPPHIIGSTLDGPSSDFDDAPAALPAVYDVTEEIPSGVHIRLA